MMLLGDSLSGFGKGIISTPFRTMFTNAFLLQLVLNPEQISFIFRCEIAPRKLIANNPELRLISVVKGFAAGLQDGSPPK